MHRGWSRIPASIPNAYARILGVDDVEKPRNYRDYCPNGEILTRTYILVTRSINTTAAIIAIDFPRRSMVMSSWWGRPPGLRWPPRSSSA